jgi:arylsulfatase A-like enzyme
LACKDDKPDRAPPRNRPWLKLRPRRADSQERVGHAETNSKCSPTVLLMADRKNLLLISVDCLRWDAVSYFGRLERWRGERLTPTLDRLCSQGAAFPVTITAAPFTTPSHASVFCSRYPFEHGVRLLLNQQLGHNSTTLAEALADWESLAVPAAFVLNSDTELPRGFKTVVDVIDEIPTARGGYRREGPTVNQIFLDWHAHRAATPWFAFLHYFDAHSTSDAQSVEHYMRGIASSDALIAEILARIDCDRTIVCVFGDHGEGLGDGEPFHGRSLAEAVIRVPLILHGCGARGVHWGTRRTIDIAPTLLKALRCPVPPTMSGRDLLDEGPRVAYVETCPLQLHGEQAVSRYHGPERVALRGDTYKYERGLDGRETLYGVTPDSNRQEEIRDPAAAAAARAAFEPHFGEFPALCGVEHFDPAYLDDPRVVERLQALGYLE